MKCGFIVVKNQKWAGDDKKKKQLWMTLSTLQHCLPWNDIFNLTLALACWSVDVYARVPLCPGLHNV